MATSKRSATNKDQAAPPPPAHEAPDPAKELLWARPGFLDQTSLAQEVGLDRSTTADVVKRLAERGLIERQPHPTDRRARQVNLTAEGKKMVKSLRIDMARAQERMLEPLQPAERAMFMHWLTVLVEANNEYSRTVLRIV
jgi:DNA-binding MarR family transcriptional regulator